MTDTVSDGGASVPGFDAPWQAQAYALTQALQQRGAFSGDEWSHSLGNAIARARSGGAVDGEDGFWAAWLEALEELVRAKCEVEATQISDMIAAWRAAYLRTPHGHPVRL